MNLPNKLTIARMIMVPVFIAFLLIEQIPGHRYIAFALFAVACFTDAMDGHIARKYNLITDFGKFLDPLADKILVSSAFICFVEQGTMPSWVAIIILSREFIISGFRLVAANKNIVIAASMWGKVKTTFQMITCFALILYFDIPFFKIICNVLMGISLVLTVVSLVDYMVKNRNVLKGSTK